jgi:hypothetical protein
MLAQLPVVGISLLALLCPHVVAGVSFELTSHAQTADSTPPGLQPRIRSRPGRLDSVSESNIEIRQSPKNSHLPLNSYDSGGIAYTINMKVAGLSLDVLVSSDYLLDEIS